MARIKKEILGKVSGTLGDLTFRQRNGKSYVSTRPISFRTSNDPASIERRSKFKLSVKLSQAIYSIDELKYIWTKETSGNKLPFNYITQINYPFVGNGVLTGIVKLVPSIGFNVSNPVVVYNQNDIVVNTDALGNNSGINATIETKVKLLSVFNLSNPIDNSLDEYTFLNLVSTPQGTDLEQVNSFTLNLSNIDSQFMGMYQNHKGYFVLITLDENNNIVHYSNTFSE